jgi:hypothetical protein
MGGKEERDGGESDGGRGGERASERGAAGGAPFARRGRHAVPLSDDPTKFCLGAVKSHLHFVPTSRLGVIQAALSGRARARAPRETKGTTTTTSDTRRARPLSPRRERL